MEEPQQVGAVLEAINDPGAVAPSLLAHEFAAAVAALPLVSVDWVVTNPDGQLLLGQRTNAPARGWWFTPGGRIRKNETLVQALQRVAREELGLAPDFCGQLLGKASLMGAWDHFYPDSAFSPSVPTHYVNLPHWLPLSWAEVALLKLPMGEQHSAWQWLPLADAAQNPLVHAYVRPYATWVLCRPGTGATAVRLPGPSLAGRNVRRRLALAKPESGWL